MLNPTWDFDAHKSMIWPNFSGNYACRRARVGLYEALVKSEVAVVLRWLIRPLSRARSQHRVRR